MAAVLAALLLCFFHLVGHLIKKPLIQIQNNHKSKIHLSGNLVEVLLHGDCGLGSAKEEQEEEEDRVPSLHLGILKSTTFSLEGLRATDADTVIALITTKVYFFLSSSDSICEFLFVIFVRVIFYIFGTINSWQAQ